MAASPRSMSRGFGSFGSQAPGSQPQPPQQPQPQSEREAMAASRRRNPPSYMEPPQPPPPPPPSQQSYASRFNEYDEPVVSPEWARKSSRQRRFTKSTLPAAHLRDETALAEVQNDYYAQARGEQLQEMSDQVDLLRDFVSEFAERKEEEWKMYDEDGNPVQRFDADGNPIPFEDEDGPLLEQPREQPKSVPLDVGQLVIKEGWIYKKGGGSSFLGRTNWTKRYMVLDMTNPRHLWYLKTRPTGADNPFEPQEDYETDNQYRRRVDRAWRTLRQRARGRVELLYATIRVPEEPREHKNRLVRAEFEFDIVCGNQYDEVERVYRMFTQTREEFDLWVKTIGYITRTLTDFRERRKRGGLRMPRQFVDEEKRDAALLCYAHGRGLFEAVAGQRAEFVIQAPSSELKFSAILESRDLHYDLDVVPQPDGSYLVSYVPTRVGTYELSVMLEDYDIQGSPFNPVVKPAPVSAPHCVAEGAGIFCAVAGAINVFTIHTRNAFGAPVVSHGVPFEVFARAPIVLLSAASTADENGLAAATSPTDCVRDHGDGSYSVQYLVELPAEDRARVERGELIEAQIDVMLNDHIHTPSFSRGIKGSPFRPILAASASAPALAAAARHAAVSMGSTAHVSALFSQLALGQAGGGAGYGHPGTYPQMVPPGSLASAPAGYVPREHMQPAPPSQQQQQQPRAAAAAPPPVPGSSYMPAAYLPAARAGETIPEASFVSSASASPPRRAPPAGGGGAPAAAPGADASGLSAEQRASIDAEREQLLRLRRELQEGRSLVDEQVERMSSILSGSSPSRQAATPYGNASEFAPPPPSAQGSASRRGLRPEDAAADAFWQSPWRAPLPARSSPSAAGAAAPRPPPSASSANAGPITSAVYDASVVSLLNKHASALRRVFRHYATRDSMDGMDLVRLAGFIKCATDFDITPTFASRKELREAFERAAATSGAADGLGFNAFVEALAHVAVDALGKPMFAHLYQTHAARVSVLLVMWGLGDPNKLDEVVRSSAGF